MTSDYLQLGMGGTVNERALLSDMGGGVTILYIEDDASFTELVARFLERDRDFFEVVTETDPHTGIEQAHSDDIDCIVCDYDMPEVNGLEAFERVREDHSDVPFILYTGKGSEDIASDAISAGVTDYLRKKGGIEQYEVLAKRIEKAVARHRAEQQIVRGFRAIETARDGISLLNDEGEFIYANESYADIVGCEQTELVGTHWSRLYPDTDLEWVREKLRSQNESEWTVETNRIQKDDTTVTVTHRFSHTRDGALLCAIAKTEDSDTVRDEVSLKERAMDNVPIGVTVTDPTRVDNPLVYVNSGFVTLTGYSREECLGRNCRFLLGDQTRDATAAELSRAIEAEESVSVELRNYRKDGEMFWNRVTTVPLFDDNDELEYVVGFHQDVTGRRELLEEFGLLGRVASHDMGNLLTTIDMRLQLAMDTENFHHVEQALESIDRLDDLIEEATEMLESGSVVGEREEIDFGEVAESVWNSLPKFDTGDRIEVIEAPIVSGDRAAIQRLLDNLFRNSLQHGNSPVRIRLGELENGFYIEDDGPGIPAEHRDQIFEHGFSTKVTGDNTGLGMASIRQIVLAHDWRIEVTESETLGGARFEIQTAISPD